MVRKLKPKPQPTVVDLSQVDTDESLAGEVEEDFNDEEMKIAMEMSMIENTSQSQRSAPISRSNDSDSDFVKPKKKQSKKRKEVVESQSKSFEKQPEGKESYQFR